MAESTVARVIAAPRARVYAVVAEVQMLAQCLVPAKTTSRITGYEEAEERLWMEITHAPGPSGTRRFYLRQLEAQPEELVVYESAFVDDPALAGEMRLHFRLEEAPGGTRVTVRHEGLPDSISVEQNEQGTASSLENLARMVEGAGN